VIDPCEPSGLSDPDDVADDLVRRKAELRALLLARRGEVDPGRAAAAAEAIAARLAELIAPEAAVVAAYWPLAGELDPRPALRRLAVRGHRLALPRMQGKALPLAFHAWAWDQPLIRGGFGVMQPDPAAPPAIPDVVLVPLLGFDRRGRRLGYGRGYYDRTLRALRAAGAARLAIGLAFALQEVEAVPAGPADEPLDAIVTETASHRWPRVPGA
jgi:5-formyltetrahydrofolate cyclo-ligase